MEMDVVNAIVRRQMKSKSIFFGIFKVEVRFFD